METIGEAFTITLKTFRRGTTRKIVERATPRKQLASIGHSQKS
jgi:hypothetical protein